MLFGNGGQMADRTPELWTERRRLSAIVAAIARCESSSRVAAMSAMSAMSAFFRKLSGHLSRPSLANDYPTVLRCVGPGVEPPANT